jgi:hypothetical protein
MTSPAPRFALNHMVAPRLGPEAFFGLAAELGIGAVEIRNHLSRQRHPRRHAAEPDREARRGGGRADPLDQRAAALRSSTATPCARRRSRG